MIPGNLAGKYRLLATLGHGGMADVYLACARGPAGFNKLLVIKELRPGLAQDPDYLQMFLDEARLAAQLSHPNIVQTYETLASDGRYFIAMEYLEGQPLNRVLAEQGQRGALPRAAGLRILSEALRGLHYAHELRDYAGTALGIVHRDATPHNVLVTYDGQVKLVDFGIAKASGSSDTRVGMLKGKVGYMAPEQARGDDIDRRTDVFGMGVVLWELLAGRRMWRGSSDVAILNRLSAGDVPGLVGDATPELARICGRATAADPRARYSSAEEFRLELEACLQEERSAWDTRRVGALVAELFASERERLRSVIQLQLLDNSRLPAVLEHTHTSRSGSLDPRYDALEARLTPSPTPAELVIDVPSQHKQELDTAVFPRVRSARRLRRLRAGVVLGAALAGVVLGALLLARRAPPPVALPAAVGHDTRLVSGHAYQLGPELRLESGVTLTVESEAQLLADPTRGTKLVLAPGARVISEP